MNLPTAFSSDRKKLDEFLIEVEMYLTMNSDIYNTDQKQIIFALSFFKDGTAGPWKQSYWKENIAATARPGGVQHSWAQFKKEVKDSFSPVDKEGDAIMKMSTEQMTGTADEYIEEFKVWKEESGVKEDRPLIEWFMQGLPTTLRDKVMNSEKPPTTIKGWYDVTSKYDNNWQRARAFTNRLKREPETKKKGIKFPHTQPRYVAPKDPNAMDVDRLTERERDDHMKRGLCFKCHLSGHRANTCPSKPERSVVRQITPRNPDEAYTQIREIYKGLDDEGKVKLTENLEETGF